MICNRPLSKSWSSWNLDVLAFVIFCMVNLAGNLGTAIGRLQINTGENFEREVGSGEA